MGLTIHYELRVAGSAERARELVHALHERARALPFDQVQSIIERASPDRTDEPDVDAELLHWLRLWGTHYLSRPGQPPTGDVVEVHVDDSRLIEVPPLHLLRFAATTEGAETAGFGLASRPASIHDTHTGGEIDTGLAGLYTWQGFCKTQYAALPQHGGIDNSLRAHLSIVELLDAAAELGLDVKVNDESQYWDKRDRDALARELHRWSTLMAAFTGQLKDALGGEHGRVQAAMTDFPDFEHLEAEGLRFLQGGESHEDGPAAE